MSIRVFASLKPRKNSNAFLQQLQVVLLRTNEFKSLRIYFTPKTSSLNRELWKSSIVVCNFFIIGKIHGFFYAAAKNMYFNNPKSNFSQ
jgi:hypothetical protein